MRTSLCLAFLLLKAKYSCPPFCTCKRIGILWTLLHIGNTLILTFIIGLEINLPLDDKLCSAVNIKEHFSIVCFNHTLIYFTFMNSMATINVFKSKFDQNLAIIWSKFWKISSIALDKFIHILEVWVLCAPTSSFCTGLGDLMY